MLVSISRRLLGASIAKINVRGFISDFGNSGRRGAKTEDAFLKALEGEFGGERVSSLLRLETKLRNELILLNKLGNGIVSPSASSGSIAAYNKQRDVVHRTRQDLIVQRELSGMGVGATETVMKEFPCPPAL